MNLDFHSILQQLAYASDSNDFDQATSQIVQEKTPLAVANWLTENSHHFNSQDIPCLQQIKEKLVQFYPSSTASTLSVAKIEAVCTKVLNPPRQPLEVNQPLILDLGHFLTQNPSKYEQLLEIKVPHNLIKECVERIYNRDRFNIPENQREFIAQKTLLLSEGVNYLLSLSSLCSSIGHIPTEERVETLEALTPLLITIKDPAKRIKALEQLAQIPKKERAPVLKLALPLFQNMKEGWDKICLTLYSISDQRTSILELATPYTKLFTTKFNDFLSLLEKFNSKHKALILKIAEPWLQAAIDENDKLALLNIISLLPEERRSTILLASCLVPKKLQHPYSLFEAICNISTKQREEIIKLALPCIQETSNGIIRAKILQTIQLVLPEKREEIHRLAVSIFEKPIRALNSSVRHQIIFLLPYLPPESLKIIFEKIYKSQNELLGDQPEEILFFLLQNNPSLQDSIYTYLANRLQTSPEEIKLALATFIWEKREFFLLYDHHPLAQQACDIITSNDPHSLANTLYLFLKKEQALPTPSIQFPIQAINHKKIVFNFEAIAKQTTKTPVLFSQLPQGINVETPKFIFEKLENMLENGEEQEANLLFIEKKFNYSFEKLKQTFTCDSYLQSLLMAKGGPSEFASWPQAHLFAFLHFILDQEDGWVIEDGCIPLLFKLATSIEIAHLDKAHYLLQAYSSLPPSYHYIKANASPSEMGLEYLDSIFHDALNELFNDKIFLKTITADDDCVKFLHHRLFLKSRIGLRVGLPYPLIFSKEMNSIDANLIKQDLSKTLNLFFEQLTPSYLIKALKRSFKHYNDNVLELHYYLNKVLGSRQDLDLIWTKDSDDQFKLTDYGALQLWIAAGYLKEV